MRLTLKLPSNIAMILKELIIIMFMLFPCLMYRLELGKQGCKFLRKIRYEKNMNELIFEKGVSPIFPLCKF